ncbi:hypothetical protein LEP1GSC074_0783 [Leptospira noguchii str. Hook]|nr:hypothetical protein LEP1GSC170_5359 [Leptospira interrogans serovar Bataviae str. HAI135]EMS82573.1 hypothetical protein LEP1GSC074_0783 [Leptospira noguchii str. Hook]
MKFASDSPQFSYVELTLEYSFKDQQLRNKIKSFFIRKS